MSEERKVALITGITGQDGSYLTELLLEKGYTVRTLFIPCSYLSRDDLSDILSIFVHYRFMESSVVPLLSTLDVSITFTKIDTRLE